MNQELIEQAILGCEAAPVARESGAALVQAWIEEFAERDAGEKTLAVEAPFLIALDPWTLVVGVIDRIAKSSFGVFGCEWKSAKEPKKNKDGSDSAWWNEQVWLEDISRGPQLGIYALALNTFAQTCPLVPTMKVRAAVKSNPVRFWPTKDDGIFQFSVAELNAVKNGLLAKAETIRALRRKGAIPWQLTGKHCQSRYNKEMCFLYESHCTKFNYAAGLANLFDPEDPGSAALSLFNVDLLEADPRLVILSASSYDTASACLELYRNLQAGLKEPPNLAQGIGTVMHKGLAAFYRQYIKEDSQCPKS